MPGTFLGYREGVLTPLVDDHDPYLMLALDRPFDSKFGAAGWAVFRDGFPDGTDFQAERVLDLAQVIHCRLCAIRTEPSNAESGWLRQAPPDGWAGVRAGATVEGAWVSHVETEVAWEGGRAFRPLSWWGQVYCLLPQLRARLEVILIERATSATSAVASRALLARSRPFWMWTDQEVHTLDQLLGEIKALEFTRDRVDDDLSVPERRLMNLLTGQSTTRPAQLARAMGIGEGAVRNLVAQIRKKLGRHAIQTVGKEGYRQGRL